MQYHYKNVSAKCNDITKEVISILFVNWEGLPEKATELFSLLNGLWCGFEFIQKKQYVQLQRDRKWYWRWFDLNGSQHTKQEMKMKLEMSARLWSKKNALNKFRLGNIVSFALWERDCKWTRLKLERNVRRLGKKWVRVIVGITKRWN